MNCLTDKEMIGHYNKQKNVAPFTDEIRSQLEHMIDCPTCSERFRKICHEFRIDSLRRIKNETH